MDRTLLAARIQEILRSRRKPQGDSPVSADTRSSETVGSLVRPRAATVVAGDEEAAFAARCAADEAAARVREVLGAAVVDGGGGPCLVVDREYPASHRHGRHLVERLACAARGSAGSLPWFLPLPAGPFRDRSAAPATLDAGGVESAAPDPRQLLFFDLETTGLSGGAGTYAFLVGCGYFDADGFRTRQFLMRSYGEERALLRAVAGFLAGRGSVIVSYNGRAFDLPVIETRYQLQRIQSPFVEIPHLDMLFPARRLWRRRLGRVAPPPDRPSDTWARARSVAVRDEAPGSCALTALERDILGLERQDDVPGWEIPARYFAYARTGDAGGLAAVLEHNRLDLLSLAAVTAVVLEMVREGADVPRDHGDCLALGRLFEYLGRADEAERCYVAAATPDDCLERGIDAGARAEALHWIALHRRRARRFGEAAEAWHQLSEIDGIDAALRREALEALAIHHEHRARDLEAARGFALRALDFVADERRERDVQHRLGRLARKLAGGPIVHEGIRWGDHR